MQHPEYLYWLALAVFGVPAISIARAFVPAAAILIVAVNVLVWRAGISIAGEGIMLAGLYAAMLAASLRMRLGTAETVASALWSPMCVCALAQACGAYPVATYWTIYWLAMAQAAAFMFVGNWPARLVRRLTTRSRARSGGYEACQA
ncbi:hypothetical protein [Sphingomonas elodea]|uniref:hypothetical protein n=1 Tax=Sphingomonas elodea TaxID=179878 RepID=UPI0002631E29|nr:hypothetical protein [Sphingomonas elodea]